MYGLRDIDQFSHIESLREKGHLEFLSTQFFATLDRHEYTDPIFEDASPTTLSPTFQECIIDGLPKCDGLSRGIADILASHYALWQQFPDFKIVVNELLVFVDEKVSLADVLVLFSTNGLPVGRNGEGGLCVLRWLREARTGEWAVKNGMHMQGSMGFKV